MVSIGVIVLGILMIICPAPYIPTMVGTLGAVLLIFALLGIFDFIASNRTAIHYVYLTGWLILGVAGTAVLIFEVNSLYSISWLFGAYMIITGISNIISAITYVKRSGRKDWWLLVLLAVLVIACGVIILINPWWDTVRLFRIVGVMMLFSSFVSILRVIWLWPIKSE